MAAGAVSAPRLIPVGQPPTGRAKNHIDTGTPVSIQSDTPGVLIFFTVDGSKPVTAGGQRGGGAASTTTTNKYLQPVLLPAGRVTVRAVAATSDGRQSSVVTKVFWVDQVQEKLQPGCDAGELASGRVSTAARHPRPEVQRVLGAHDAPRPTVRPSDAASLRPSVRQAPDLLGGTQASRAQRSSDFLRCPRCLAGRPADPLACFCAQCGAVVPPLPAQRLPPSEGGQTLLCVFCNTLVPINSHTCLVCEHAIQQQLRPQASRHLQDHVLCVRCGSGNPVGVSSCVTCESQLQQQQQQQQQHIGSCVAPSVRTAECSLLPCSGCKRMNLSEARFCSWCGRKPGHELRGATCRRCGANGQSCDRYCASCGAFVEATPTSCMDITPPVGSDGGQPSATWWAVPASDRTEAPPTANQCTQTTGLFYPSATELQRKEQQRAPQFSPQLATGDRRPPQSAVSPGRGYWRKQLDHVCAHLRSYAQNNAPFRAVLGEPRLGRIVSAVVQEDAYEVSVTVSFVSVGREEQGPPGGRGVGGVRAERPAETLSSVTEGSAGSGTHSGRRPQAPPQPPVVDVQLLAELGPDGGGSVGAVQLLLDQGAEPSCCGSDGRHALAVAAVNGHCDVLPVLVQRGADVDQQSGRMKNTALHEAAARGLDGLRCAQVLLSCGASARRRNGSGQTAYDVALDSGCVAMASLLAAQQEAS